MSTPADIHRLVVDGETFAVAVRRVGHPGYHVTWLSGPHAGYGFTTGEPMVFTRSDESSQVDLEMEDFRMTQEIRRFLDDIDPETGYVRDR